MQTSSQTTQIKQFINTTQTKYRNNSNYSSQTHLLRKLNIHRQLQLKLQFAKTTQTTILKNNSNYNLQTKLNQTTIHKQLQLKPQLINTTPTTIRKYKSNSNLQFVDSTPTQPNTHPLTQSRII